MIPTVSSTNLPPTLAQQMEWYQPTHRKYTALQETIRTLKIRDKREIMKLMRKADKQLSAQLLLPRYGFTLGEFSTFQTLLECARRSSTEEEGEEQDDSSSAVDEHHDS